MSWILTASARVVEFPAPLASEIHLDDIAHHLAQVNRYVGACSRPYSVAEHSLFVCHLVEQAGVRDPHVLMAALLHDAHEAYTGDISSPLKLVLGDAWRNVEQRMEYAVLRRFDLLTARSAGARMIRWADLTALITERHALLPPHFMEWPAQREHPPVDWDFSARAGFNWLDWAHAFVERFQELQFAREERAHQLQECPPHGA